MALIARVYRSQPDERRGAARYPVEVDATLRAVDGVPLDVLIYDLSMTGFRMETSESLDLDSAIWIGIAGTQVNAALVARRGPNGYGCEFVTPITFYQLTEALNPEPVVVDLGRHDRSGKAIARIEWNRVLLAAIALGAFILCVVSLWPF
jgi:hypothetical protein